MGRNRVDLAKIRQQRTLLVLGKLPDVKQLRLSKPVFILPVMIIKRISP